MGNFYKFSAVWFWGMPKIVFPGFTDDLEAGGGMKKCCNGRKFFSQAGAFIPVSFLKSTETQFI